MHIWFVLEIHVKFRFHDDDRLHNEPDNDEDHHTLLFWWITLIGAFQAWRPLIPAQFCSASYVPQMALGVNSFVEKVQKGWHKSKGVHFNLHLSPEFPSGRWLAHSQPSIGINGDYSWWKNVYLCNWRRFTAWDPSNSSKLSLKWKVNPRYWMLIANKVISLDFMLKCGTSNLQSSFCKLWICL